MLLFQLLVVSKRHFPELLNQLANLREHRIKPQYSVQEIYLACIYMFIFKRESRNAMNLSSEKGAFRDNYFMAFGMKFPHMDTVALFMEKANPNEIETIKCKLVQKLISKKIFRKFLLNGRYPVAVDATGVGSYDYEPWPGCPYKEYKSGKKIWQVPILEAKLVFYNGFSISLCSQWILNTGEYKKQNCEQKEFSSLAEKIKKYFSRLPIVILADGLYPNDTVLGICEANKWQYIITLKDGNLKTLWEEVNFELLILKDKSIENILKNRPTHKLKQTCRYLNGLKYKSYDVNWLECIENETNKQKTEQSRFVFLSNIIATKNNIISLCAYGRKRWNIENEGFDQQKNHGYGLKHKFSRRNINARKIYYQCMQIAHLINQLVEKSQIFITQLKPKESMESMWDCLIAFLWLGCIQKKEIEDILECNCQIRY